MSLATGSHVKTARPLSVGILFVAVLLAHIAVASAVALYSGFPSTYDEIAHISFIKALAETPALFPHYGGYHLLDPNDLSRWTSEPNYLAHPSLYYLLMSPIWQLSGGSVLALRFADVALSSLGLALTAAAGARLIEARRSKLLFVLLVFCFPKNPVIGGIISNDNLVLIATGFLFCGCASPKHRTFWLCLALIIAGWTKLTAFVGLAAAAGAFVVLTALRGPKRFSPSALVALAFALLLGFAPYAVNWLRSGHLLYVPQNAGWILPDDQRLHLDVLGYAQVFFRQIANKFPAADRMMDDALPLAGLILFSFTAVWSQGETQARHVAISFLAALVIFLPIHFYYAWQTFVSSGQTSDAQPRYYNELWPGLALALTLTCATVDRNRWPIASISVVILCLLPTAVGLLFFSPSGAL